MTKERNKFLSQLKSLETHGFRVVRAHLPFEGGDVVVGDKHVFIGPQAIHDTALLYNLSYTESVEMFERAFRKKVFVVKNSLGRSIQYHADLVLAVVRNKLTGKEVVLLNSERKFLELTMKKRIPDYLSSSTFSALYKSFLETFIQSSHSDVEVSLVNMKEFSNEGTLRYRFDETLLLKDRLEREGYEVVEVPGFDFHQPQHSRKYHLKFINYVNLVVGSNGVLMPVYGIKALDDYMKRLLQNFGYSVIIPMESSREAMKLCGGPRCMTEAYYEDASGDSVATGP